MNNKGYLAGLGIVQEVEGAGYPDESTETQILDLPPHIISDITELRAVPPPQLWTPADSRHHQLSPSDSQL